MRVADEVCVAKGSVSPGFMNIRTGEMEPFGRRSNTLSYMSAEAMAAAFGGDPSYIPARIGFIYGDQENMPTGESSAPGSISRSQTWRSLCEELESAEEGAVIDIQVVGFSYAPTLGAGLAPDQGSSGSSGGGSSGNDGDYCNILPTGSNAITFHAVSNSQDIGAVSGSDAFASGNRIYQCVLLGFHENNYYVIARASLKDGDSYLRKPDGFEVALDWTVTFR